MREHGTAVLRSPVDEYRARAAFGPVAADLRPGQTQLVAQRRGKRLHGRHFDAPAPAVDGHGDEPLDGPRRGGLGQQRSAVGAEQIVGRRHGRARGDGALDETASGNTLLGRLLCHLDDLLVHGTITSLVTNRSPRRPQSRSASLWRVPKRPCRSRHGSTPANCRSLGRRLQGVNYIIFTSGATSRRDAADRCTDESGTAGGNRHFSGYGFRPVGFSGVPHSSPR